MTVRTRVVKAGAVADETALMVVGYLNTPSTRERLERWVESWLQHGRDLRRLPRQLQVEINQELATCLIQVASHGIEEWSAPEEPPFALEVARHRYCDWSPTMTAAGIIHLSTRETALPALRFVEFAGGPHRDRLERCGRVNCGNYFLREGRRTKYCSARCAHHDSAARATRQGRQLRTNRNLIKAERLMKKYGGRWPLDWRAEVTSSVGVTKNWLTWHMKRGHLPSPPEPKAR